MSARPHWIKAGRRALSRDRAFRQLLKKYPEVPLRRSARVDLFQSLTHAIVNQQLSGRVADVIYERLRNLFPGKRLNPGRMRRLRGSTLRKAGLSWNKIRFLKDLARHLVEGRLPQPSELDALPDEMLMERLTAVNGIGPWTVQMLLIFKLGRPDVFPHADLGVQKGFQRLFGLKERPTAKFILAHSQRWKPYRTLAAWYLWRACEDVEFNPTEDEGVLWTKS